MNLSNLHFDSDKSVINLPDFNRKQYLKALVIILELLGVGLIIYLIGLPILPQARYKIQKTIQSRLIMSEAFPGRNQIDLSINQVIIDKIKVKSPIIDSPNSKWALSKGAWRVPESSTPPAGGNMVISGHRFRYLPPNNLTFYLFHELVIGDKVTVVWNNELYHYQIKEIKIVPADDLSILEPTDSPILTMFTCDPIFSTENRLVVISEPIEV